MEKRPYRTNEDLRIEAGGGGGSFEERSKSADGRLNAGFKRRDPKLSQFRSSSAASTETLAAAGVRVLPHQRVFGGGQHHEAARGHEVTGLALH